jgi:hypothetical protein
MGMQSFREPLIVAGVQTAGGRQNAGNFGRQLDDVYAVDAQGGSLVWQKHLKWSSAQAPGAGEGRRLYLQQCADRDPGGHPGRGCAALRLCLANDGYLHTLDVATGDEKDAPIQNDAGAYGKAYGLNLVNNVVYTVTGQAAMAFPMSCTRWI